MGEALPSSSSPNDYIPNFCAIILLDPLYCRGGLPVLFRYPFSPVFALVREVSLLDLVPSFRFFSTIFLCISDKENPLF